MRYEVSFDQDFCRPINRVMIYIGTKGPMRGIHSPIDFNIILRGKCSQESSILPGESRLFVSCLALCMANGDGRVDTDAGTPGNLTQWPGGFSASLSTPGRAGLLI